MNACLFLLDELIEKVTIDLCVEGLFKEDGKIKLQSIQKIEELIRSKIDKSSNIIERFTKSGILDILTSFVAIPEYEKMYKSIVSIIKLMVKSKSKCIEVIIEKIIILISSSERATYGIFSCLSELSRSRHCRHRIINKEILDYLLSHINIDCLYNDNGYLLKMIQSESALLASLMHFERNVNGEFVKERSGEIASILNCLLYIDDEYILNKTFNCFKYLNSDFISTKSIKRIIDLLMSNNIDIVKGSISCLNRNVSCSLNVDEFMRQNILKKLFKIFGLLHYDRDGQYIIILCILIEKLMRYSKSEYIVDCLIKNNIIQCVIKIIDHELQKQKRTLLTWPMEIIWSIMDIGNLQHIYFMILTQNIIYYLCDKQLYLKLIQKKQDRSRRGLKVFYKILKIGNICSLLVAKYNGFELIEYMITESEKIDHMYYRKAFLPFKQNKQNINIGMNLDQSELIISYFVGKYNIPESIQCIIMKFYFLKCPLSVNYLQFELNVNDMVIMKKNKQCNYCKNIQENMKRCSGCKYSFYCNTLCQTKDWKSHKSMCHQIKNYFI